MFLKLTDPNLYIDYNIKTFHLATWNCRCDLCWFSLCPERTHSKHLLLQQMTDFHIESNIQPISVNIRRKMDTLGVHSQATVLWFTICFSTESRSGDSLVAASASLWTDSMKMGPEDWAFPPLNHQGYALLSCNITSDPNVSSPV